MAVEPADATLPDPPPAFAGPPPAAASSALRRLNRGMVPLARAGLGAWLSTPLGGGIMLLRVRGRRTGLVREVPLNYLVAEGHVWLLAGLGPATAWYRNLQADARVDVILPGRALAAVATEVRDAAVRGRIVPALLRTTPLPSLLAGLDVRRLQDEELTAATAWLPLLRLDSVDGSPVEPGPDDPGGRGWIWRQAIVVASTVLVLACAAGIARRVVRLSLRRDTRG